MKRLTYKYTVYACYIGYVTESIVNTFAPLLFLTFQGEFGISLERISLLISINFCTQIVIDWLAGRYADKFGYRTGITFAHVTAAVGIIGLAMFPSLFPDPFWGLLLAVMLYAVGGGLLEVLVTPIVEACPDSANAGSVSLLHSFYNWGQVAVLLISTAYFALFGTAHWRILAVLWALVPLCNTVFLLKVPMNPLIKDGETGMTIPQLIKDRRFLLLLLLVLCAGASECGISQWASTFAEAGLGISKAVGDLAGPTCFALLMGTVRALHGRFGKKYRIEQLMLVSGVICLVCYLTASLSPSPVGGLIGCALCGLGCALLWPGSFSVAADSLPRGGTAMFALLSLFGDLGGAAGPALIGVTADHFGGSLQTGLLFGTIFSILLVVSLLLLRRSSHKT